MCLNWSIDPIGLRFLPPSLPPPPHPPPFITPLKSNTNTPLTCRDLAVYCTEALGGKHAPGVRVKCPQTCAAGLETCYAADSTTAKGAVCNDASAILTSTGISTCRTVAANNGCHSTGSDSMAAREDAALNRYVVPRTLVDCLSLFARLLPCWRTQCAVVPECTRAPVSTRTTQVLKSGVPRFSCYSCCCCCPL